jgi:hypothetical protein
MCKGHSKIKNQRKEQKIEKFFRKENIKSSFISFKIKRNINILVQNTLNNIS